MVALGGRERCADLVRCVARAVNFAELKNLTALVLGQGIEVEFQRSGWRERNRMAWRVHRFWPEVRSPLCMAAPSSQHALGRVLP